MFVNKLIGFFAIITARTGRPEPGIKKAQVVTAVAAIATLAAQFGIQVSNNAQGWAVRGVMFAVVFGPIVAALMGRKHTTPLADPQAIDADGNVLALEPVPADHVVVHRDVADRGIAAAVNAAAGTTADVAIDQTSALGHAVGGVVDVLSALNPFKHGDH